MAFKVDSKERSLYDANKLCKHYNREGHNEESCFQLIGFPEWWEERGRSGRGSGRGGHTGRGGRGRARSSANGSAGSSGKQVCANKVEGGRSQGASPVTIADGDSLASVSSAQVQQIIETLSNTKSKPKLHGPVDDEGDWRLERVTERMNFIFSVVFQEFGH